MGVFAALGVGMGHSGVAATVDNTAIVGKNDWLFVRHEVVLEVLDKDAQSAFGLMERFNRMLAHNQIMLVVVVVPSKMETYAEQLPDDFKVSAYMRGFNDMVQGALRAGGVQFVDLKKALRNAALQSTTFPVFFRLDTHWTPTGAMTAAQTLQAGIMASPSLKKALDAVPAVQYKLSWASKPLRQVKSRDIVSFLPVGTPEYPPEEVLRFKVSRENGNRVSLLGGAAAGGEIGLVGSSFSGDWTGFPDALRYTLQRDLVNFSVNADAGQWAVMRAYLRDDAFQVKRPKLVIWEIPERAVGFRPSYPYRHERYRVDDNEWLLQVAALVPQACAPAAITAKLEPGGVYKGKGAVTGTATEEADFVEISFDKPVDHHSYLSARITSDGSKQIRIEALDGNVPMRKFSVDVAGDELAHPLKTPLSLSSKGVSRIKLYPGKTNAFGVADVEVCRYPEN